MECQQKECQRHVWGIDELSVLVLNQFLLMHGIVDRVKELENSRLKVKLWDLMKKELWEETKLSVMMMTLNLR